MRNEDGAKWWNECHFRLSHEKYFYWSCLHWHRNPLVGDVFVIGRQMRGCGWIIFLLMTYSFTFPAYRKVKLVSDFFCREYPISVNLLYFFLRKVSKKFDFSKAFHQKLIHQFKYSRGYLFKHYTYIEVLVLYVSGSIIDL